MRIQLDVEEVATLVSDFIAVRKFRWVKYKRQRLVLDEVRTEKFSIATFNQETKICELVRMFDQLLGRRVFELGKDQAATATFINDVSVELAGPQMLI